MTIDYIIESITKGTIKLEEIEEAKTMLENEIEQCRDIVQDPETELYSRIEFREKLTLYTKLKNRL